MRKNSGTAAAFLTAVMPAVIMMCLIFWFSARPADQSSRQSGIIVKAIVGVVDQVSELSDSERQALSEKLEWPVRKAAHMTEYGVLALCFYWALYSYRIRWGRITALILTGIYACTDEFHQTFVPGRSGSPRDVFIDTAGAAVFLAVLWIIQRASGRRRSNTDDGR